MFSIQKIVVFVVILLALWIGFRLVGTMARRQKLRERLARPPRRRWFRRAPRQEQAPAAEAVDMVACGVCGDYVTPAGARSCERRGCPHGRAA